MTPAAVWEALSDVERTALQVSLYRCDGANTLLSPTDGEALYDGTLDLLLVNACMPAAVQAQYRSHLNLQHMIQMVAFRTIHIDAELVRVVSTEGVQQVVILGAGLDARAWRLQWPDNTTVLEVDTGSLEAIKTTHLAAVAPKSPSCQRKFLKVDLAHPQQLQEALQGSGLDAGRPVVWVLEGLVGYLKPQDSLQLFNTMFQSCAAGSTAIVTAPPTPKLKEESEQSGQRLHHATFESATETVSRLAASGWKAALLDIDTAGPSSGITWKQLAGEEEPQGLITARKVSA